MMLVVPGSKIASSLRLEVNVPLLFASMTLRWTVWSTPSRSRIRLHLIVEGQSAYKHDLRMTYH